MDERALSALEEGGELLILSLTDYAYYRANQLSWNNGFSAKELPGGKTPEDFVFETLEKVLTGPENNWDPERGRFDVFLRWIIKRDLGHLARSSENRKILRPDNELPYSSPLAEETLTPEEIILVQERDRRFHKLLYESVEGDSELEELLLYLDEGVKSTEILAQKLGVPKRRIYSLKNKLAARIKTVQEQLLREDLVSG